MTSMSPRTVTVASMAELEAGPVGRSLVVIVNDRTAHGDQDTSGPLVTEPLPRPGLWSTVWWLSKMTCRRFKTR